ncbi:MAG: glycoside hydrolase family 2 [Chloroflexota bacterium]|nr:glycoside hydrolase family 2 [Chloroflexota bacterium]
MALRKLSASPVAEGDEPADRGVTNALPRSVMRGGDYVLLDGEWRFELDPQDKGLVQQWYRWHGYSGTIGWPGAIEEQLEALARSPEDETIAWYERDFTVPERWRDRITQLTFGACGYETRVWLNGHPLKTIEGEEVHIGEYTSFTYELPADLLRPVNRLTVRISDPLDAEIPRGKQASRVYKRGGIWYQTISGALRSVWIEAVDRNRLRSRLGVLSAIEKESRAVEFALTTRIHDPGDYTLRVRVFRRGEAIPMAMGDFPLPLPRGERRQRVTLPLPDAALWSPRRPVLYTVEAELIDAAGKGSRIRASFGLRKIERRGRQVYLNNRPLYLDGILYQPGTATYEQMRRHLRAIKALGCNLVRIHIAGIDPRIYDLADELGLLVWVEVPSPHSSSERSRENHRAEVYRMLPWVGSHPSVAIWSLYNEDWGAEDIAESAATRAYIAQIRDELRRRHPQVLIVDNDGWNHVSVEGELQSDLLTAHIYKTDPGAWRSALDRLAAGDQRGVTAEPLVVGDPFFYAGQVPIVVSEWGGFGFPDYGGPREASERARLIRAFKRELRARAIAGDVYTQATDIEDERNGIIDAATGALRVPPGILASRRPRARLDRRAPVVPEIAAAGGGDD